MVFQISKLSHGLGSALLFRKSLVYLQVIIGKMDETQDFEDLMEVVAEEISDSSLFDFGFISEDGDDFNGTSLVSKPICDSQKRFSCILTNSDVENLKVSRIPLATIKRNKWANNIFKEWAKARKEHELNDDEILYNLSMDLNVLSDEELNFWLSKFVLEIRNMKGKRYPRDSLISVIAGIQQILLENKRPLKIMKDREFSEFQKALDASCKLSSQEGLGCQVKRSEIITLEDELKLWNLNILGGNNPQQLMNTLLYLNGIHFALRSGPEHRKLKMSQLEITLDPPTIIYKAEVSKTFQGGLSRHNIIPKVVKHVDHCYHLNPERSHVRLFEKFSKVRPHNAQNIFYLKPKPVNKITEDVGEEAWYYNIAIGHNTLSKTVSELCKNGDIGGRKTNHSLRATCATRMFDEGIEEQIIMERTGHCTSKGVRAYKRTSSHLISNSSAVLDSNSIIEKIENNKSCTGKVNFNFTLNNCNVKFYTTNDQPRNNDVPM